MKQVVMWGAFGAVLLIGSVSLAAELLPALDVVTTGNVGYEHSATGGCGHEGGFCRD